MVNCQNCGVEIDRHPNAKYCEECSAAVRSKEFRRSKSEKREWDSASYLGLTPSEMDWARLAAFVDGEGSINFSPRKTNTGKSLTLCGRVQVTNTNPTLITWCQEKFGMVVNQKPFRGLRAKNWKPCYFATACAYRAAWICRNILPWLMLKKGQAEIVLAHQKTTKAGTWERGSGVVTPKDLLDYRAELRTKLQDLNRRGPKGELGELSIN